MVDPIPVIDIWSPIVPSREIMQHVAHNFPEAQLPYLRVFGKHTPSLEEYREFALALARDDETILGLLDDAGIRQALITGFDEASTAGKTFVANEAVAALAQRHRGVSSRSPGRTSCAAAPRSASSSTGCGSGASTGSACGPS